MCVSSLSWNCSAPGHKLNHLMFFAGNSVSGGVSLAAAAAYAANKKSKVASDFYRFQAREKKRNDLVELQNQFAAAKKQVHALRQNRKFQG